MNCDFSGVSGVLGERSSGWGGITGFAESRNFWDDSGQAISWGSGRGLRTCEFGGPQELMRVRRSLDCCAELLGIPSRNVGSPLAFEAKAAKSRVIKELLRRRRAKPQASPSSHSLERALSPLSPIPDPSAHLGVDLQWWVDSQTRPIIQSSPKLCRPLGYPLQEVSSKGRPCMCAAKLRRGPTR